ncbi:MAG TPA: helix-turn-helix domain-containing protein [Candidatus Limnocylindrales bacterium]|nr:helix-turn-helix domain-containing protein [Candidatus Limnocylindrales bacterium]
MPEPTRAAVADDRTPAAAPAPQRALAAALDRVGDRWSLLVVEALLAGSRRFNELGEVVTGIAPNILSDRLRRLERAGIVVATPYSRRPVRMEYSLTQDGRELAGALRLLADWGSTRGGEGEPLRHETCGTPLEARWHCPTCGRTVEDADTAELTRF